jgi:hypothetical protein
MALLSNRRAKLDLFKPFDFGLHARNAVEATREKQLKSRVLPAYRGQKRGGDM